MDHDFVSVQKKRNEEFEELYRRGLESYVSGDWIGSQTAWMLCNETPSMKNDGALIHMNKLMEKSKGQVPDNWNGGFDWDQKPEPPEIEFLSEDESSKDSEKK